MIRPNESITGQEDDGEGLFELKFASEREAETGWQHFTSQHIRPGQLFRIAVGLADATDNDLCHLGSCDACRTAYDGYRSGQGPIAERQPSASFGSEMACDAGRVNGNGFGTALNDYGTATSAASLCARELRQVPSLLRQHLRVEGPVLFPGGEIALQSWQFGRIQQIAGANPELAEHIVDTIAEHVMHVLLPCLARDNLMLVCFGRAMHRCGTRLSAKLVDLGFGRSHVVLAHDYYSPTLVCDPKEFKDSDTIVLVDVVHSGTTLDKVMSLCLERNPRRLRGLALIDQSGARSLCAEWLSVWTDEREIRISVEEYLHDSPDKGLEQLQRYEPNDECAVLGSKDDRNRSGGSNEGRAAVSVDTRLLNFIHMTDALKQDHLIGEKRYPYVVNVLDLLKNSESRGFVLDCAEQQLADLAKKGVCLAYHAGRSARAGEIAKLLNGRFGWPAICIGSRGPAFTMTQQQYSKVACYETVLVVDSAIRTGDSLAAMARALEDMRLWHHTSVVALCILDALSGKSRLELSEELGIDIRTLFKLPLSPPTEEVRHWANQQKAIIREKMLKSGEFASVQGILEAYCDVPHSRSQRDSDRTLTQTRSLIEEAIAHAQLPQSAAKRIDAACAESKAHLIRHLSLDDVVHDRTIQDLLVAVMFNSMKPKYKESAAFALAAARNYDWMTIDWLKCNRPFFTAASDSWKCIVMVECHMKMTERTRELSRFREAAVEFRDKCLVPACSPEPLQHSQLMFPGVNDSVDASLQKDSCAGSANKRLRERLDIVIEAAT